MKKWMRLWVIALAALLLAACGISEHTFDNQPAPETQETQTDAEEPEDQEEAAEPDAPSESPAEEEVPEEPEEQAETKDANVLPEDGTYTSKEEVAEYIHLYGRLPDNFITKKKPRSLDGRAALWNLMRPESVSEETGSAIMRAFCRKRMAGSIPNAILILWEQTKEAQNGWYFPMTG